jgi:hypothetical protein
MPPATPATSGITKAGKLSVTMTGTSARAAGRAKRWVWRWATGRSKEDEKGGSECKGR